uniref:Vps41 C-terminal RING finger domain-containing protein n=1 Tax=Fagus sylvatica TaxID=28930 RepID=A0A2N9GMB6_FAGSY
MLIILPPCSSPHPIPSKTEGKQGRKRKKSSLLKLMLRDRLVKIITDYRTETSLRHGCNDILKADCVNLLVKYYKEEIHGICLGNEEDEARAKRNDNSASQAIEKSSKCESHGVITFFCCHAYHMTCLMDSTYNVSGKKGSGATSREPRVEYEYDNGDVEDGDEDDDDDDDTQSGERRVRCILCTTASS